MNKISRHFLVLSFFLINNTNFAFAAGGACTFSDNCTAATNFNFCSPLLADNTTCDGCGHCDPLVDTYTPAGPDWGNYDECDRAFDFGGGCGGTYTDPCGECTATITCMAAIASCANNYSFCGSPENTSYSKACVPATWIGSCAWVFSVSGIACSGGGASLQWGVYPAGSDAQCATLTTNYPNSTGMLFCDGDQTVNQSTTQTLVPGSCYLIMFDGNAQAACTWTMNVVPPNPTATFTSSATSIACGGCVTFTNTGSCFNQTSWTTSDGQSATTTNASFCFASAGSYTVTHTVTGNVGACAATKTATASTTITVTCGCTPPAKGFTINDNTQCLTGNSFVFTNTGAAVGSCGAGCPTYYWDFNNDGITETTGTTAASASPTYTYTSAGTYTVEQKICSTPTCCDSITATVTVFPMPSATIANTNVLCSGACTGSADLTPAGGTPAYTYKWSNGPTTQDQIGTLCAGTYTATVRDANACLTFATVAITQPTALTASIYGTNISCSSSCIGSASITGSGGTGAYTYKWNTSATTSSITGLCIGTYTGTVRDANNCMTTGTVVITSTPPVSGTVAGTNITCNGLCNGSASITGSSGTAPYTYKWSSGPTTSLISGLCAGTFTGTIRDANNCMTTLAITITQPATLVATFTTSNSVCTDCLCDGWALFSVVGGTMPMVYSWSNGYNDVYQNKICPGAYTANVTDANGCTASSSVTVLP